MATLRLRESESPPVGRFIPLRGEPSDVTGDALKRKSLLKESSASQYETFLTLMGGCTKPVRVALLKILGWILCLGSFKYLDQGSSLGRCLEHLLGILCLHTSEEIAELSHNDAVKHSICIAQISKGTSAIA